MPVYIIFLFAIGGGTLYFLTVFFIFFYISKRFARRKILSTERVDGIVVGYAYAKQVIPPIVEYIVDGKAYKRQLEYCWTVVKSAPWLNRKAVADTLDLLSENLVISRNSIVSYTNVLEEAFPKGSTMTVWYNPQNPKESYVERFCNKDKLYKKLALLFLIIYIIYLIVFITLTILSIRYNWKTN
ncbi:DUF3592 domain-containing protein [Streptococcus gordonii]|uniref:DUF3592 domain-containing protein n=1 Tax=Streptococcus gordonii TaxID=1302 RepID=UPI001C643457|nr:DUF3592 domain-containing protein [Streptococcus gordonii]MBW7664385.1 DUF3592 domain-containing protein [Streptococcus gordonii]